MREGDRQRHKCVFNILVCSPDVVEHAGQEVGLVEGGGGPGFECVGEDGLSDSVLGAPLDYVP